MYTYGLITYEKHNKRTLCITNEMMFDHFKEKFDQYYQPSTEGALKNFLSDKQSSNLEKLLKTILEPTTTQKDNYMSEGAIQLGFEIALLNHLSQCKFNYSIKGSSPFQQKKGNPNPDFEKKVDMKIEFDQSIILIEFKRARPNSIKVMRYDNTVINGKDWTESLYKEQQDILSNKKEEDLKDISFMGFAPEKYGEDGKKFDKKEYCATLGDLLVSAINQLTGYIKALKQHEPQNQEKKVYAFAVIHAAQKTFIVDRHHSNGKKLKDM